MLSNIERIRNINIAKTNMFYGKTVSILMEERPEFDIKEAERLGDFLRENGYFVKSIDSDALSDNAVFKDEIGGILIISHASSVPAVTAGKIRKYFEQGGIVLVLGGVLFAKHIAKENGEWKELPLTDQEFDAAYSGKTEPIVIEGIVPTYKTYKCNNVTEFKTANDLIFSGNLSTDKPLRVVSPVARSYGGGYKREYENRFIPIVNTVGDSPRNGGITGSSAFIMLSDTKGHLHTTAGNRPGSVLNTVCGSAIGSIGITNQNLLDIKGMDKLILSMLSRMSKSVYLFEAGAERFVYTKENRALFGAKVLNVSEDFKNIKVKIHVLKNEEKVYSFESEDIIAPCNFTEFEFLCDDFIPDDYTVLTTLYYDNEMVDRISHKVYKYDAVNCEDKNEFVKVEKDKFVLGNKEWKCAGINYWPLYYPSLERYPYWRGMFDKSNYFQEEIEKDIAFMKASGVNCLFLRMDGNVAKRCDDTFKDFLLRCRKHGMKISVSYCMATNPFYYNGEAFRQFMELHSLKNDPIIFSHDICWEVGHQPLVPKYRNYWDMPWENWIIERYGSIQNAQTDFGYKIDVTEDGRITIPPENEIITDGDWRVKTAAFRRFLEDYFSSVWNKAVYDIKKYDPNHLVANRLGLFSPRTAAFSFALKHVDFNSIEGYSVALSEEDYHISCGLTAVMNMQGNNKPLIWSEVGMSVTGMTNTGLLWDHEKEEPFDYMLKKSTDYMSQFIKMFKTMNVNGAAPWWWPGGFRMVEMSDCGFCGPDGKLRPIGKVYSDYMNWLTGYGEEKLDSYIFEVDPDTDARGFYKFCNNEIKEANKTAEKRGARLKLVTPATGKTTAELPLIAVGNVPFNGNNPLKYINGEFTEVLVSVDGNEYKKIEKGEEISVFKNSQIKLRVKAGNLRQAKWLSPLNSEKGGIYVCSVGESDINFKSPLISDTDYLEDGDFKEIVLTDCLKDKININIRFMLEDKAVFGECFSFVIKV